jgi:hypothetical protein
MSEVYRVFSNDWKDILDYSDESLRELYELESGITSKLNVNNYNDRNGFSVGKKWLSVHVEMWKEDIEKGLLFKKELYEDEKFPHWWLDSIFKTI